MWAYRFNGTHLWKGTSLLTLSYLRRWILPGNLSTYLRRQLVRESMCHVELLHFSRRSGPKFSFHLYMHPHKSHLNQLPESDQQSTLLCEKTYHSKIVYSVVFSPSLQTTRLQVSMLAWRRCPCHDSLSVAALGRLDTLPRSQDQRIELNSHGRTSITLSLHMPRPIHPNPWVKINHQHPDIQPWHIGKDPQSTRLHSSPAATKVSHPDPAKSRIERQMRPGRTLEEFWKKLIQCTE